MRTVPYLRPLALMVALGALARGAARLRALRAGRGRAGARPPCCSRSSRSSRPALAVLGLVLQAVLSRTTPGRLPAWPGPLPSSRPAWSAPPPWAWCGPACGPLCSYVGSRPWCTASLYRSGYELVFTPLPLERKRATKALVDVGFDKIGSVAGGLFTAGLVAIAPAGRAAAGAARVGAGRGRDVSCCRACTAATWCRWRRAAHGRRARLERCTS